MRWALAITGALGLLAVIGRTEAGLYNTAEPIVLPTRDFRKFQDALITLRQSALPIEIKDKDGKGIKIRTPLYRQNELIADLSKTNTSKLTLEQRLDVSAYLIRVLKYRDAANLLSPAQFQERDNFLVLSNLATAEQLDGQLLRARDYLSAALQLWPTQWTGLKPARREWLQDIGWNEHTFLWFREVETYQLKLIRLRSREAVTAARPLPDDVDRIFDVDFVGPSGKYEAGKLSIAQQAKLPKKAIEIVEQLLLWMPNDMRLSWLLGELYNAEGNVPVARAILQDVAAKWNPRAANSTAFASDAALPALFKQHLAILQEQPASAPNLAERPLEAPPLPAPGKPPPEERVTPVDWKSLSVGFGGGIVVAFLAAWQLREIRRKRASKSMA
jgi:hypothetical protein